MKIFKKLLKISIFAVIAVVIFVLTVNIYMINVTKPMIDKPLENPDCILIFGCGLRPDGTPSDMLRDRLETGISLYEKGEADKIIVSGDHGQKSYDEVNAMKKYMIDRGVSGEDIFMDHAGFSTYESVYRAKEIFEAEKIILVTQKYHLYRAIYICRALEVEAVGRPADLHIYRGQTYRDIREAAARCKDFFTTILKPEPKYLGETIPVGGNGDITND